jgi:hypothetical protein
MEIRWLGEVCSALPSNPNPSPATRFKPGPRKVGRATGTPNKVTVSARQVLDEAFNKVGGVDRLAEWILKSPRNEYAWWTVIWPRTIPLSATVKSEIEHTIRTGKDLEQALRAHGLPTEVYGYDKPILDLEPRLLEHIDEKDEG